MPATFAERLAARVNAVGAPLCVGLDPHLSRIAGLDAADAAAGVWAFSERVIEAVAPHAAMLKPQSAFFEALGAPGVAVLQRVIRRAQGAGLLVLLDAKRGDIGSTAEAYARATLDDAGPMGADAVTLSPYLGPESLAPFADRFVDGKGAFVLVRTSNPGAGPWQVQGGIAERVAGWVEDHAQSAGAVIAATLPSGEGARWRARMPTAWFLVPGVGAQGATPAQVHGHRRADGSGALITSSRAVLFPATGADAPDEVVVAVGRRARTLAAALW